MSTYKLLSGKEEEKVRSECVIVTCHSFGCTLEYAASYEPVCGITTMIPIPLSVTIDSPDELASLIIDHAVK